MTPRRPAGPARPHGSDGLSPGERQNARTTIRSEVIFINGSRKPGRTHRPTPADTANYNERRVCVVLELADFPDRGRRLSFQLRSRPVVDPLLQPSGGRNRRLATMDAQGRIKVATRVGMRRLGDPQAVCPLFSPRMEATWLATQSGFVRLRSTRAFTDRIGLPRTPDGPAKLRRVLHFRSRSRRQITHDVPPGAEPTTHSADFWTRPPNSGLSEDRSWCNCRPACPSTAAIVGAFFTALRRHTTPKRPANPGTRAGSRRSRTS